MFLKEMQIFSKNVIRQITDDLKFSSDDSYESDEE